MARKGKFLNSASASRWYWWCLNLLHLETLFFIVIILFSIYVVVTGRKKAGNLQKFEKQWRHLSENAPKSQHSFVGSSPPSRPSGGPKKNKHEEKCREIFQGLFRVPFETDRPDWLVNPVTNSNLELDGWNPHIITPKGRGLAFEYDGIQHSVYDPHHFHSEKRGGKNAYIYQVKKDAWKDKRCAEEGVVLIRIPHYISWDDMEDHIKTRLQKEGVDWRVATSGPRPRMYD